MKKKKTQDRAITVEGRREGREICTGNSDTTASHKVIIKKRTKTEREKKKK